MNKALFYSLMESHMLIRDSSKLLEISGKDEPWRASTPEELAADKATYKKHMDALPQADKDRIAKLTAERNKRPSILDIEHRKNPINRMSRQASIGLRRFDKYAYKMGGKAAQMGDSVAKSGVLSTIGKVGAGVVPGFLLGSAYAGHKVNQHPDVKTAKSVGSAINTMKKYAPHAAVGVGGLLALKALSNND